MFSASVMTVAYTANIQEQVNDFSFNLMSVTAPILLKITQFGVQSGGYFSNKSQWYYRPEIGVGYGPFSLGASYTWMFTPTGRTHGEKWMVTAAFNYPIWEF